MKTNRHKGGQGDGGQTSLGDGSRVDKDHPRIEALGALDEATASLGCARSHSPDQDLCEFLAEAQRGLFEAGALLCLPGEFASENRIQALDKRIRDMEARMDQWAAVQEPLCGFVLPGDCQASAFAHLARTCVRRAERRVNALAKTEPPPPAVLAFLNRLGAALFALTREMDRRAGASEKIWTGGQGK